MDNSLPSPSLDLNTNFAAQRRVRDYYARLPPARKAAGALELLPWHLLPSVTHVQRNPRNTSDRHDGTFIQPSMLREAEAVLSTFVKLTITSRGISTRRLDRMAAICLVLQIIKAPHLLDRFLEQRISDASLPLSRATLISVLRDVDAALDFLGEQYRAKPRQINPLEHVEFEETEPLPYMIQRNLGIGGYGKVDQVQDTSTGKVYAMKSWKFVDQNAKSRLLEEASVLKKLVSHKHVVRLINTYARGKVLGIVMDPVATCDLSDLIEARPRDRAWAVPILQKAPGCLASALADMHALKIRHKDISPRNILICHDNILLTDFGLSIDVSEMSRTDTSGPTARTLNYCSPEVASQQRRGRKSDVFSLGCVILVILSLLPQTGADWLGDVLSFRPFHRSLESVEQWIQEKASASDNASVKAWLRSCSRMVQEEADRRSTIQEILDDILSDPFLEETFPLIFCNHCLGLKDTSGLAAIRNLQKVSSQDSSRQEVPSSLNRSSPSSGVPVTAGMLATNPDVASYVRFFTTFSGGLGGAMSKRSIAMNDTTECLAQILIGLTILECFIPDLGIHPQVMNANFRLFDPGMYAMIKGCRAINGSDKGIPGYWIASGVLKVPEPYVIQDMFEDTAKWYYEMGEKFNCPYINSETFQQRKSHGPGPMPKSKGEWEWLASTLKEWKNHLLSLLEQGRFSQYESLFGKVHDQLLPSRNEFLDYYRLAALQQDLHSSKQLAELLQALKRKGAFATYDTAVPGQKLPILQPWDKKDLERYVVHRYEVLRREQIRWLMEKEIAVRTQKEMRVCGTGTHMETRRLVQDFDAFNDLVEEYSSRLLDQFSWTSGENRFWRSLRYMAVAEDRLLNRLSDRRGLLRLFYSWPQDPLMRYNPPPRPPLKIYFTLETEAVSIRKSLLDRRDEVPPIVRPVYQDIR